MHWKTGIQILLFNCQNLKLSSSVMSSAGGREESDYLDLNELP